MQCAHNVMTCGMQSLSHKLTNLSTLYRNIMHLHQYVAMKRQNTIMNRMNRQDLAVYRHNLGMNRQDAKSWRCTGKALKPRKCKAEAYKSIEADEVWWIQSSATAQDSTVR